MQFIKIKVNCPRDFAKVYQMTIRVFDSGEDCIPAPCNGCDFLNNSPDCNQCIKSIFKMAIKDPTMESYKQPINP